MKLFKWIGLGLLVLVGLLVWRGISAYNGLVKEEQNVTNAWSKVEAQYQRRMDLIPNLVNTVKGQADYEKSTLEAVIKARASATQVKIDPSNMTDEDFQRFQSVQNNLSSSLSRLLVSIEKYPELKAHSGFTNLQVELAGTENRITFARNEYNDIVKTYNVKVKEFPTVIFARLLGFTPKPYFKSQVGADSAPSINFDFSNPTTPQSAPQVPAPAPSTPAPQPESTPSSDKPAPQPAPQPAKGNFTAVFVARAFA